MEPPYQMQFIAIDKTHTFAGGGGESYFFCKGYSQNFHCPAGRAVVKCDELQKDCLKEN